LQNSREEASQLYGDRFHGEGCAHAPFAAHSDPKQQTQDDEEPIGRRQPREKRNRRVEDHVEHERQLAAVAVGHDAEQNRADRARHEAAHQRRRNRWDSDVEILGDRGNHHDQNEEIKRIQRPAEKSREDSIALVRPTLNGANGRAHTFSPKEAPKFQRGA